MGFSKQEYWSGLPCPPPEDRLNLQIESKSPASPALVGGFLTTEPPGKPSWYPLHRNKKIKFVWSQEYEVGFSFLNHTSIYFLSHTIIELNFIFKPSLRDRCYFNFADKLRLREWSNTFKITLLTGHRLAAHCQFCMTWTSAFFSLFHAWVFLTTPLVTLEEVSVFFFHLFEYTICILSLFELNLSSWSPLRLWYMPAFR